MGLLGVYRWLIPMFGQADHMLYHIAILLSVIGIVYASCLAMVQDNIKKLVAYSSIAHIGLMSAALFSMKKIGVQGVFLQMFNHGINIVGMWIVVEIIERKTGIKKIAELGGLAKKAPALTIFLVIISFANIALPLTNAFPGEFMLFSGLYQYNPWLAMVAGLGVILSAVYTLNMVQKVFYGTIKDSTSAVSDIEMHEKLVLTFIILIIFTAGVYPQPLIDLTKSSTDQFFTIIK
jgi:NADH-quinone oxidoreductase subunit M